MASASESGPPRLRGVGDVLDPGRQGRVDSVGPLNGVRGRISGGDRWMPEAALSPLLDGARVRTSSAAAGASLVKL